jgi:hypothetical protein
VVSSVVTAVSSDEEQIFKNYPNPFGGTEPITKFIFWMDGSGSAEIKIYTLLGGLVWSQRVEGLSGDQLYDGLISWDGLNSAGNQVLNGVYIAVINIQAGGGAKSFKTKVAYVK